MARRIDVNCDIGETPLAWWDSDEPELMRLVTSANVACGGHAGDERSMEMVCKEARRLGVAVGAQVSYPDREHFGRRAMEIDQFILERSLHEQFEALDRVARAQGVHVSFVKPHGALYNVSRTREDHANAIVGLAAERGVRLVGLADSHTERLAAAHGVGFVREWFADRGYMSDGGLAPRSRTDALVTSPDEVRSRVIRAVRDGVVETVDGATLTVDFATICVHSDTPGATTLLRAVHTGLNALGVVIGH